MKRNALYWAAFAAFGLGLVLGFVTPGIFGPISFLGDIYVNLLKLIVIPLLMTEVACGVYASAKTVGGRLVKTVVLFIVMFAVSFGITALLVTALGPGRGVDLFGEAYAGDLASTSPGDFLRGIFPSNIFAAMSSGSILPCILFAFAFGVAASGTKAKRAMGVVEELRGVFGKILGYIMWLTPLGVFSLMGSASANYGAALVGVCAKYIGCAWLGCAVVTLLVMILPVWIAAGVNPVQYIKKVSKVWLVSLSTCSSAATLPTTIRVCNEDFGVPESVTSLVVPLGCTIHMCGGAVSFCLLGLFTMQMAGVSVTAGLFLYMLLTATLINMAAPGIPGGGIVIGTTWLTILGAPTGFIGLYSGIYRILDMAYTTLNVTGDITANVLIAKGEKKHGKEGR